MFTQPLMIGSTYRLKFKSVFERHGVCTTPGVTCLHKGGGVFRLEQITNFRDVIYSGIKLYDVFFKPLGISEMDYRGYFDDKPADEYEPEHTVKTVTNVVGDYEAATVNGALTTRPIKKVVKNEIHVETGRSILKRHLKDKVNYASYPIYKFVDVIDANDMIWVPELTIAEFPEIDIREYRDLSLVIHLGYTHDPATLDPMLLSIRERMAAFGWRPSLIRLYATATKWMSPDEYDAIKEIRIPATIETITNDPKDLLSDKATVMRKSILHEMMIDNGSLKQIVEPQADGSVVDPTSEVSVDAIMRHKQIIDNNLFLTECNPTEVFIKDDVYYVEENIAHEGVTIVAHRMLREGYDYQVGDPCVAYKLATEEEVTKFETLVENGTAVQDSDQLYIRVEGQWNPIPYGENANYDPSQLFTRAEHVEYSQTRDRIKKNGKQYYIQEVNEYGSTVGFRPAVETDFEDGEFPEKTGNLGFYELSSDSEYVYKEATEAEITNPQTVLYVKNPDTYEPAVAIEEDTEYFIKVHPLKEDYSTYRDPPLVGSLQLLGFKFDYDDDFGKPKTITLQLEDIIEAASSTLAVVLPSADLTTSSEDDPFWQKFMGRRFRWERKPEGSIDPTLTESIEFTITNESRHFLAEKSGLLLGESGTIYKEIYVKDSGKQKRNYYMQYVIQQKKLDDQKRRIADLEAALITLTRQNESLAAQVEELQNNQQDS